MEPTEAATTTAYAEDLTSLRATARWMLAACASVALVLVAGLQLAAVAQLAPSSWRLYTAVGSVMIALAATLYMIWQASTVLIHEWLTLAQFTAQASGMTPVNDAKRNKLRDIEQSLDNEHYEVLGGVARTCSELHQALRQAHAALHRTTPPSGEALAHVAQLQKAARDAAQYANYHFTLHLFRRMRRRLAWGAAVVVLAIGGFAYAANPPKEADPVDVKIVSGDTGAAQSSDHIGLMCITQ